MMAGGQAIGVSPGVIASTAHEGTVAIGAMPRREFGLPVSFALRAHRATVARRSSGPSATGIEDGDADPGRGLTERQPPMATCLVDHGVTRSIRQLLIVWSRALQRRPVMPSGSCCVVAVHAGNVGEPGLE